MNNEVKATALSYLVIAKALQRAKAADALPKDEPDALILRDLQGKVIAANPAACNILNVTQQQLIGRPPCMLVCNYHPDGSLALPHETPSMVAIRTGGLACGAFGISRDTLGLVWTFVEAASLPGIGALSRFRMLSMPFAVASSAFWH